MKKQILYQSTITGIGDKVAELLNGNMIVLFCDLVPEEMQEICVLHKFVKPPHYNFRKGDIIQIGDQEFVMEIVGDEVMHTFKGMGHLTIRYTSDVTEEIPLLPGFVLAKFDSRPVIKVGDPLIISRIRE